MTRALSILQKLGPFKQVTTVFALLFASVAGVSATTNPTEIVWHIGNPVASAPPAGIRGIEAVGGKIYYLTSGGTNTQAGIIEYDPITLRSRYVHRAQIGASINAIRKDSQSSFLFTESAYGSFTIKRYNIVTGDVTTLATPTAFCADPWDILVENGSYVLACSATNSLSKLNQNWQEISTLRPGSGVCNISTKGLYTPISIEKHGNRYIVSLMGCRVAWDMDLNFDNLSVFAGINWQSSIGNITTGQTKANTIAFPAAGVRKSGPYILIGTYGGGVAAVNPNSGIIEYFWSSGRQAAATDNDPLGFGRYVADDGYNIWAAGPQSLVSFRAPWYTAASNTQTPTATSAPSTRTPTLTHTAAPTATNTPKPTPTATSTSTAAPQEDACRLAQQLVSIVCQPR